MSELEQVQAEAGKASASKVGELEAQLVQAEDARRELKEGLEVAMTQSTAKLATAEDSVAQLQSQLASTEEEREQLRAGMATAEEERAQAMAEIEARLADSETRAKSAAAEAAEAAEELERLKVRSIQKTAERKAAEAQIAVETARCAEMEETHKVDVAKMRERHAVQVESLEQTMQLLEGKLEESFEQHEERHEEATKRQEEAMDVALADMREGHTETVAVKDQIIHGLEIKLKEESWRLESMLKQEADKVEHLERQKSLGLRNTDEVQGLLAKVARLQEELQEEREKSAGAAAAEPAGSPAANLGNAKTMGELRSGFAKITASLQRENKDAIERAQQVCSLPQYSFCQNLYFWPSAGDYFVVRGECS